MPFEIVSIGTGRAAVFVHGTKNPGQIVRAAIRGCPEGRKPTIWPAQDSDTSTWGSGKPGDTQWCIFFESLPIGRNRLAIQPQGEPETVLPIDVPSQTEVEFAAGLTIQFPPNGSNQPRPTIWSYGLSGDKIDTDATKTYVRVGGIDYSGTVVRDHPSLPWIVTFTVGGTGTAPAVIKVTDKSANSDTKNFTVS